MSYTRYDFKNERILSILGEGLHRHIHTTTTNNNNNNNNNNKITANEKRCISLP